MDDSEEFLSFTTSAAKGNNDSEVLIESERSNISRKGLTSSDEHPLLNCIIPKWIDDRSKNSLERKAPPFVRLHNEILKFCQFISPTKEEIEKRESVITELKEVVSSLWPEASVHVFGSQLTSIIIPSSDIDITILNVPLQDEEGAVDAILTLTEHIRKHIAVDYLEAIVNARVPIVKYEESKTKLSVDICINHDSGLRTGELIKTMSEQYPPLRPLTLVLKTFLSQRKLNDTYSGGIGSFLLSSMVLSFLQHKQRTSFYSDFYPAWNLGSLLLEFFYLYGIAFNYYHTGLSVRDGGKYFPKYTFNNESYHEIAQSFARRQEQKQRNKNPRKRKYQQDSDDDDEDLIRSGRKTPGSVKNTTPGGGKERPGLLCVENPDAPDQDIGKNSYQLMKIRRTFEHAYQLLTVALNDPKQLSFLCYVIRASDPMIANRVS